MKKFYLSLALVVILMGSVGAVIQGSGSSTATGISNSATLPATCSVGQVYIDTDATAGRKLYYCDSTDSWLAVITSEAQGLTDILAIDRIDGDATSASAAILIGSAAADSYAAIYYDATGGIIYTCKIAGVMGACDRYTTLNAGKKAGFKNSGGTIGFQYDEATNKITILAGNQADDQIWVADSATAGTMRTLPDCTDAAGNHLNYTQSTNTFSCGTTSPEGLVRKTADVTIQSDATPNDDANLLFSLDANSFYTVELFLLYASDPTADFSIDFTLPAGATGWRLDQYASASITDCSAGNGGSHNVVDWLTLNNSIGGETTTAKCALRITGQVATAGTAGTFQFQWAQGVSQALNTTLFANSWLRWRKH